MTEKRNQTQRDRDQLEKEYHEIGINALQAATCIKTRKRQNSHDDYGDVIEDTGE